MTQICEAKIHFSIQITKKSCFRFSIFNNQVSITHLIP